jgi:hypothetical protein
MLVFTEPSAHGRPGDSCRSGTASTAVSARTSIGSPSGVPVPWVST